MKSLLCFFILSCLTAYGQHGSIKVEIFSNSNCILSSNVQLDSVSVKISGANLPEDIRFIYDLSDIYQAPTLPQGVYSLEYHSFDGKTILVDHIEVSSERITFVSILIEPNCDLSFRQKRLRRKNYENYK